jgi:hypothetical protein
MSLPFALSALRPLSPLLSAALLCAAAATAQAAPTVFSGGDPNVGPAGARPNSDGQAAAFNAAAGALGPITFITFEGFGASSPAAPTVLAPGVTYTPTNPDGFSGIFVANSPAFGFNTTSGGTTHLRYSSSTVGALDATFSFATPIAAFGAYFTNAGGDSAPAPQLLFNDGSPQSLTLIGQSLTDSVQFFGFAGLSAPITSITLRGSTLDVFGIDDIRFVTVTPIPEPGTWALMLAGLAVVAVRARRQSRA